MAGPFTLTEAELKQHYQRIAGTLFDLAKSTRPAPIEVDLRLAGLPQATQDALQANADLADPRQTETVETDQDIFTGLVYNEELGRRVVDQLVEEAKRTLKGQGVDPSELLGQIASQLLSLGKITPEETALLPQIEGSVTRLVTRENALLRAFPGRPLYGHRLSGAIQAAVATGVITPEQAAFITVARGGAAPTTQQGLDAVTFLDKLEANLPTRLTIAQSQSPNKPSSLKANLESQVRGDLDAITAGTGWMPSFGKTAAQIQAERAEEDFLELFDVGNEKQAVETLLLQTEREEGARLLNVSSQALGPAGERTAEQKADREAADLLIASAQDAQGVLADSVRSGRITSEDAQRELRDFLVSQIGPNGIGFDSLVANLVTIGQLEGQAERLEEFEDPAKRRAETNKKIANLGFDPNDILDADRKAMEDAQLGNPQALDDLTAADVQSLAQKKAQQDFAEGFVDDGDKAVESTLERLGIGDPFDEEFQQHLRDTVVPRLADSLKRAAEGSPLTFDPEALAGQLLGLPGFRQEPEAVLTPTVPPGLQGAPGELGIPPGPPLVPEHLRPSPEDRAFRRFRDQQPSPLIGFGDDPVFLDREQFRQHFDPSRPPTPPDPVLDFINQYQPTLFERGLNQALGERGQRQFQFGPPPEQPFTGLERPGDVPLPDFPGMPGGEFVPSPSFTTDLTAGLRPNQFRVEGSENAAIAEFIASIAGDDFDFQQFLLSQVNTEGFQTGFQDFVAQQAALRKSGAASRLHAFGQRGGIGTGTARGRSALLAQFERRDEPIRFSSFFEQELPGFRREFEASPGFRQREAARLEAEKQAEIDAEAERVLQGEIAAEEAEIAAREAEAERRRTLRRGRVLVRG